MKDPIREHIPVEERLAGLAEEAAELAQAALKLRRVYDGVNPTPVSEELALEHLYEEIADVKLYCSTLDLPHEYIDGIADLKKKRWTERLVGKNG